jgi:carbon-monoxide dehydrogenase large subunit
MHPPISARAERRIEDRRLLTGAGCYTDDTPTQPGELQLVFVRSPVAHGELQRVDVRAAKAHPGVVDVFTVQDLDEAGVRDPRPSAFNPEGGVGGPVALPQPALARGRVRFAGEPVVAIVADSVDRALDAADLIRLDIDELPAAAGLAHALADGAPQICTTAPANILGRRTRGDAEATQAAFARAAHRVEIELVNNRVSPVTLEPRCCVALPGPLDPPDEALEGGTADGAGDVQLTLITGTQGVHGIAADLAAVLDMPVDAMRVISPDVGGGFGMRLFLQGETVVAAWAAMRLRRPVRWTGTRSEAFLADLAGRDHRSQAELALDAEGRFLALRARTAANVGAYTSRMGAHIPWFGASMLTGVYDIPVAWSETLLVVSNSAPVDAYRGAGRPEASYLIERLVDKAARVLAICPRSLRRRNFVAPEQFPYTSALGQTYDSGEYAQRLAICWERGDGDGFPARRAASAARGRLRGLGLACYVEVCAGYGDEDVQVRLTPQGGAEILVGTQSTGQGHETAFAQIVAQRLGVAVDGVRVHQGDTALIRRGGGTGGSRTLAIAGSALAAALDRVIEMGRRQAAVLLGVTVDSVAFDNDDYSFAGSGRSIGVAEVVRASHRPDLRADEVRAGLEASGNFAADGGTFPNGCHLCEVEVDAQTGRVDILRHTVEDDLGRVLNPLLLEGQIVGGTVQGLSQALLEQVVYEEGSGRLLSGSFMDYGVARAAQLGRIDFGYGEVPSPRNPLGLKGAGEAGTIGAPAALVNAVLDALSGLGVRELDMPLTPQRVWDAIRAASAA